MGGEVSGWTSEQVIGVQQATTAHRSCRECSGSAGEAVHCPPAANTSV